MAIRKRKLFYPKGEQKLGLLTKGKEWMDAETYKEYKGPYHRFSDGVVMTGGSPSKRSRYLMPYKDQTDASAVATQLYRNITTVKVDKFIAPQYHFPKVGQKDLTQGYITRYFVQKRNDLSQIFEIDSESYNNVNNKNKPGIDAGRYRRIAINWSISGPRDDVQKTNHRVILNSNVLELSDYLTDLLEFYK